MMHELVTRREFFQTIWHVSAFAWTIICLEVKWLFRA